MNPFAKVKGMYKFDSAQYEGISSLKMRGDLELSETGFISPSHIRYGQMGEKAGIITGYGSIETANNQDKIVLRLLRLDRHGIEPQAVMQLSQACGGEFDLSGVYQGQIFDINAELLCQIHARSGEPAIRTNLAALLEKVDAQRTLDSLALTCNFEKKQF